MFLWYPVLDLARAPRRTARKKGSGYENVKQLADKAKHAMFSTKKKVDFHSLNPKLAIKIFDSIISPILLYNSEVWGAFINSDLITKITKLATSR